LTLFWGFQSSPHCHTLSLWYPFYYYILT
jgi:hypothetical protein